MSKYDVLDDLIQKNNGFVRTSDAEKAGVSRPHFMTYTRNRGLVRVAHGLYMSEDAWDDGLYVIQTRYPAAVFSHETALFLCGLAEREPLAYSLTLKAGANATGLTKDGVKVYKVKDELFDVGIIEAKSPVGHALRSYNLERTICDLVRSRRNIEVQDFQSAIKEYVRRKGRNIPQLMRYAELFSVSKMIRQYMEVLL
jgi:hypothetical protein